MTTTIKRSVFVAVIAVLLILGATVPASAATYKAPASCALNLTRIKGFPKDLADFNRNHYDLPGTDIKRETKEIKDPDGTKQQINTGRITVPVTNKSGTTKEVKKVNYAVHLERHRVALRFFDAKKVDTKKYTAAADSLEGSINIEKKKVSVEKTNWENALNNIEKELNCDSKKNADQIKNLAGQRATGLKTITADKKKVADKSADTSRSYKAAAKVYKDAKKAAARR